MNKKNYTIIASLALLIISIVGATYAFFSVTAQVTEQNISLTAGTVTGINYDSSNTLNLNTGIPGDRSDVKTFTITNPATNTVMQSYNLALHIDANTFTQNHVAINANDENNSEATNQLVMYVGYDNCTVDNSEPDVPLNCDNIHEMDLTDGDNSIKTGSVLPIIGGLVEPGETHTYYVYLKFVETDMSQDENRNKSFGSHVELTETSIIKETDLPYNDLDSDNKINWLGDPPEPLTLANYIIKNVPKVTSGAGLYHHTATLTNSAADNSYRYSGYGGYRALSPYYSSSMDLVNNWLCFGESDGTNCSSNHSWRILGVMSDKTIKLVFSKTVHTAVFDSTSNDGVRSNVWANSTMKASLNSSVFLNNSSYMNAAMRNMLVVTPTWNIGALNTHVLTPKELYDIERTEQTTNGGTVALMTPSDYGFASSGELWDITLNRYYNTQAYNNNWLRFQEGVVDWMITPNTKAQHVFALSHGTLLSSTYVDNNYSARPVVFLKADVLYVSGDGTYTNMYTITQ